MKNNIYSVEEVELLMEQYEGKKTTKGYRELKDMLQEAQEKESSLVESPSEGLGDTLEKVFKATGIDKVAKAVLGDDCGCNKRKDALNKLIPYGAPKQVRCFTEEEGNEYLNYMETRVNNKFQPEEISMLFRLYEGIYNKRYNMRRMCTSCMGFANILRTITLELDKAYNSPNN